MMAQYPVTAFEHMGEQFDPARAVDDDHPLVASRPDLFTAKRSRKTATTSTTDDSED